MMSHRKKQNSWSEETEGWYGDYDDYGYYDEHLRSPPAPVTTTTTTTSTTAAATAMMNDDLQWYGGEMKDENPFGIFKDDEADLHPHHHHHHHRHRHPHFSPPAVTPPTAKNIGIGSDSSPPLFFAGGFLLSLLICMLLLLGIFAYKKIMPHINFRRFEDEEEEVQLMEAHEVVSEEPVSAVAAGESGGLANPSFQEEGGEEAVEEHGTNANAYENLTVFYDGQSVQLRPLPPPRLHHSASSSRRTPPPSYSF